MENTIALALHGGAGARAGRDYSETEAHLEDLTGRGRSRLREGARALDVVEYCVMELESCGFYVAGRGSAPNSAGYVELDASIMDGASREAGAVASIRGVINPVSVARQVMEKTQHVMLAGSGALAFAREHSMAEVEDPANYYVLPIGVHEAEISEPMHGTVGAVALDGRGQLAAATSTGGTFAKLEGRVGDSPLIGAGTWADDRIAISCTGTGEHIIRAGGAVSMACRFKSGMSLDEVAGELLNEIKRLGGDAGIIAITADGQIASPYNSEGMKRASFVGDKPIDSATFE